MKKNNDPMRKTEIYLIRHGQPVLQNALLGSTDSPLSELGEKQLIQAFDNLPDLDLVISSPLMRCSQFSQRYTQQKCLPLQIDAQWQECYFGDWDGKTYEYLHQHYPDSTALFFAQPDQFTPPNGESLAVFCIRVERAISELLEQHQGKKIAVLTHAGIIRTLVAWCLSIDYASGCQFRNFSIDYAHLTHFTVFQQTQQPDFVRMQTLNHSAQSLNVKGQL